MSKYFVNLNCQKCGFNGYVFAQITKKKLYVNGKEDTRFIYNKKLNNKKNIQSTFEYSHCGKYDCEVEINVN